VKTIEIGTVVEPVTKWNPRSSAGEIFTYLDVSSVDNEVKAVTHALRIRTDEAPSRARQLVVAGDVLVSTVRPNLNAVAMVPAELDGATASTGFCVLRPCRKRLNNRYLYHWVRTPAFVSEMVRRATGATYPAVSDRVVKSSMISVPPIEEQKRIASILDAANALRAKRRQALEKLDSLIQSIFVDMFGDLDGNSRGWTVVEVGSFVRESRLGLVRNAGELGDEHPVPYIRMNAIRPNGELSLADVRRTTATTLEITSGRLDPGDLLFNTRNSRELVGKTALFREHGTFLFNNNLLRLRFTKEANPEYINVALRQRSLQQALEVRKAGTTNVFAIYFKDLATVPIPLPPIDLQCDFAGRVESVRRLGARLQSSEDALKTFFASIQHRAFRGEL
jgi:type I restriction enzyme S subunit